MSHEITKTDNIVLVKDRAWHGLGTIIPEGVSPLQALDIIKADWGVRQYAIQAIDENGIVVPEIDLSEYLVNARADTNEKLGLVSPHYKIFTNRQVAEFASNLVEVANGEDCAVKIETAGTIQGGKKVWFLLQGESFEIGNKDEIIPYVLVSNGHDGKTSLKVTPTTIRVVCSNTLHMVIPRAEATNAIDTAAITVGHMGDLDEKIGEARRALAAYSTSMDSTKRIIERLQQKEIKKDQMIAFFTECYQRDLIDNLNKTTKPKVIARREERSKEAFRKFTDRFDAEVSLGGASWWTAFNAYSGFVQHDTRLKGKDNQDRIEKRTSMNLLGKNADRTHQSLQLAISLAL